MRIKLLLLIHQIIIIISLVVVCSINSLPNYTLELSPQGRCTVHLKSQKDDLEDQEVFSDIVDGNKKWVIWTLWSSNDSEHVTPSINFYEFCSINILIEHLKWPSWQTMDGKWLRIEQSTSTNKYLEKIVYSYGSWTHSIAIIVRNYCSAQYQGYLN